MTQRQQEGLVNHLLDEVFLLASSGKPEMQPMLTDNPTANQMRIDFSQPVKTVPGIRVNQELPVATL